ncbi:MAG: fructosamine kinase family protein, partial [Cyanobacteriota bacterium]|nr:fructosamine kinase family protein [Cyanobacteriota bacterium]
MVPSPVDPLAAWLKERLDIELLGRTPVGGGCIHSAWCLRTGGEGRLFVKTNQADRLPLLEAEAEGLLALGHCAPEGLVVPQPLALGQVGEEAVLVLPWLEMGRGDRGRGAWAEGGARLARLHRRSLQTPQTGATSPAFGWSRDNFIGASPQENGWHGDWAEFFSARRLRPQLTWLAR